MSYLKRESSSTRGKGAGGGGSLRPWPRNKSGKKKLVNNSSAREMRKEFLRGEKFPREEKILRGLLFFDRALENSRS